MRYNLTKEEEEELDKILGEVLEDEEVDLEDDKSEPVEQELGLEEGA